MPRKARDPVKIMIREIKDEKKNRCKKRGDHANRMARDGTLLDQRVAQDEQHGTRRVQRSVYRWKMRKIHASAVQPVRSQGPCNLLEKLET